jgi:hypothetical protein
MTVRKILVTHDGTNADFTDFAILTLGNGVAGLTVEPAVNSPNLELNVFATDAIDYTLTRVASKNWA